MTLRLDRSYFSPNYLKSDNHIRHHQLKNYNLLLSLLFNLNQEYSARKNQLTHLNYLLCNSVHHLKRQILHCLIFNIQSKWKKMILVKNIANIVKNMTEWSVCKKAVYQIMKLLLKSLKWSKVQRHLRGGSPNQENCKVKR